METNQMILNKEELYFELKAMIRRHGIRKAAVAFNCEHKDNVLLRYLTEMGLDLTEHDFSGISYEKASAEKPAEEISADDVQLIAAIGDGALVNSIKYLKSKMDIPVIAMPTCIEAGEEANGRIFFAEGRTYSEIRDEKAIPEYVLFDPDAVLYESEYYRNSAIAKGICEAMNVMWTNGPDTSASEAASRGLKTLLGNITRIFRGEKDALAEGLAAAHSIGYSVELAENAPSYALSCYIADSLGISPGHAMMISATPFAEMIEDRLRDSGLISMLKDDYKKQNDKIKEAGLEDAYQKMKHIYKLMASETKDIHSLSFQLAFFERAFELQNTDTDKGRALAMSAEAADILSGSWPQDMTDKERDFLFLRLFHYDLLGRAADKIKMRADLRMNPKTNRKRHALLLERYNDDPSYDRLIPEPDYEEQAERQKLVKGLQKEVLETLLLSKAFFEENGLTYYLSEGTLLGAVRHKGFIPWDDDVDIMMPRDDYNRLVELDREGKIPPELHLDALENNPKHWVLGAKLQLTRESAYVQPKVAGLSEYNGPYIDVFPLDYWNSPHSKKQYRAQRMVKMCRRLLFMKTGYSRIIGQRPHRVLMMMAIWFIPNTRIEKLAIKNMTKFNGGNRKFMVHLASYYPYYKEVFPASCYGKPVYKEFEGHMFPVPKEYDYILRTIYGNSYDSLPPARYANLRNHPFEVSE